MVKIRLQLQIHSLSDPPLSAATTTATRQNAAVAASRSLPIFTGKTLSTMRAIVRQEGLTGLWKGNIPAEMLYVCYGAIQFTTYRSTTQLLANLENVTLPAFTLGGGSGGVGGPDSGWKCHRLPTQAESFLAGAVAGGIATATTYPLDLLRTRFAAQGTEKVYASLVSSVRDIARHEGVPGFFRGCTAAVGQVVPYMGLFFATYETLRPVMSRAVKKFEAGHERGHERGHEDKGGSATTTTTSSSSSSLLTIPPGAGDATAGMLASVLAKTGVFPLDLVRKRLQVQGPTRTRYVYRNIPEYKGVWRTMAMIVRTQGVRGLYRGLTVSLIKAAPASAVTMWTYERALGVLQEREWIM